MMGLWIFGGLFFVGGLGFLAGALVYWLSSAERWKKSLADPEKLMPVFKRQLEHALGFP